MRWPRILEVHDTELGPIFLEKPAGVFRAMWYYLSMAWYWLSTLIVDDQQWGVDDED